MFNIALKSIFCGFPVEWGLGCLEYYDLFSYLSFVDAYSNHILVTPGNIVKSSLCQVTYVFWNVLLIVEMYNELSSTTSESISPRASV